MSRLKLKKPDPTPKLVTMSAKQVAAILHLHLSKGEEKWLPLQRKVGHLTRRHPTNISLDLGGPKKDPYIVVFSQHDGELNRVVSAITPKGVSWDGKGNPLDHLSRTDHAKLLALLAEHPADKIEVVKQYVVQLNGTAVGMMYDQGLGLNRKQFPKGLMPNRFYEKSEAEEAAKKFREYWADVQARKEKTKGKGKRRR